MLLPQRYQAYIPLQKLTGYLLSESHNVGKSKAKFLRQHGFDESNIALLERGLLNIAQTETVINVVSSPFGTKYILDGRLKTPPGIEIIVRTVWIIEPDEPQPRFVTAYPA
jgi:hypothetical protein